MQRNQAPSGLTPAAAHLAVVRSTLSIIFQTAAILVGVFFVSGVLLGFMRVPEGRLHEAYEIVLICALGLPTLYQVTLRPIARLAAEHAAAAAETRFQAVAQATHDGIVIFDHAGVIQFANKAIERMHGYPRGELRGKSLETLMPEETQRVFREELKSFALGGSEILERGPVEQAAIRANGERFAVEISVNALTTNSGTQFVVVVRDISARKHAERELQERTLRLNALIANNPLAVVVLDKSHRVQMCNRAFEELFQYQNSEIAGLELDGLVAPPDLLNEALGFTQQNLRGKVMHAFTRRRRKDGMLVEVELHAVPLVIDGRVEGAYGLYQDLTERRLLEKTASELELRYEDIFNYANDAILIFRPQDEVIVDANPAAAELYGYAPGELIGASLQSFTKDVERGKLIIEQLLKEGSHRNFETVHFRKDGQPMTLICSGSLIDYQGSPAVMGVMHDITERKCAELAVAEAEKTLRKILETIPLGVRIVRDGAVVFANPADARLHGFDLPAEEIGTDALSCVAEEDQDRLTEFANRRIAGEEAPRRYTARRRRRDGTEFQSQMHAELILYRGAPASLLVIEDLTNQDRLRMYEQILPVCCMCGKIRDDQGAESGQGTWDRLDHYIAQHSDAKLSHTFCPACMEEYRRREGLPAAESSV